MARSIDAGTLVTLPKMDAGEAHALARSLVAAATEKKGKKTAHVAGLTPGATAALEALVAAEEALESATQQSLAGSDRPDVRAADRAEDAAWSALFDFLTGWSKLPETVSQSGLATKLLAELFPDRLAFTKLPFKTEWAEVDHRIQRIDAGLSKYLDLLGAKPFLAEIRSAHAGYSEALGISTGVQPAKASKSLGVKDPLRALGDALRTYALQAVAIAIPGDKASEKLSARLLAPLARWESPRRKASPKPATPVSAPSTPKS